MAQQLVGPDVLIRFFGFEDIRSINDLVNNGIITPTMVTENGKEVRRYDLIPTTAKYIAYLKDRIKRKGGGEDKAEEIAAADLRYKSAKAGKMELELAELRGQMHRQEDVEVIVNDMIANIRAAILALPGSLAVNVASARTPAEASAIIKQAVDDLLNDMARYQYDPNDYRKLVMEREKWINAKEAAEAKKKETTQKTPKPSKPRTTSKKPRALSAGSAKASKRRKA